MSPANLLWFSMLLVTLGMVAGYLYGRYFRPELFTAAVILVNMLVIIGLGIRYWSSAV